MYHQIKQKSVKESQFYVNQVSHLTKSVHFVCKCLQFKTRTQKLSSFLQLTSATLHNSSETIDHILNIEPTLKILTFLSVGHI